MRLAKDGSYDAVILCLPGEMPESPTMPLEPWLGYVMAHAPCQVFLWSPPRTPRDVAAE